MSAEVERIRTRLRNEGQKAEAFFDELPDAGWERRVYGEGPEWRVRDVLAHFISAERTFVQTMREVLRGGPGLSRDFDIDTFNAREVPALARLGREELRGAFRRARAETLALVDGLDEADLQLPGWHPWFGDTQLGEMLQLIYRHTMLHLRDVRRALQADPPAGSAPEDRLPGAAG